MTPLLRLALWSACIVLNIYIDYENKEMRKEKKLREMKIEMLKMEYLKKNGLLETEMEMAEMKTLLTMVETEKMRAGVPLK